MKQFYYFSKNKLKFIEIRSFYRKFVFLTVFFSILLTFFIFSGYFILNEFINPDAKIKSLQAENRELSRIFNSLLDQYKELDAELDYLTRVNNDLRLSLNLNPITSTDEEIGVGGRLFPEVHPSSSKELNFVLNELDFYINKVGSKVNLEKNNYSDLEEALKYNNKLYDAIPAIKPTNGAFGDKFGMRLHPILKINRMHNGIDIITRVGTEVYAPGAGKVIFTGRRDGYGRTIEIDHGFGYKTLFAHLSKVLVKKGQLIKRGDLIALSGKSGNLTTGPHLHYEIRHNGIALNPRNFMFDDLKLFEIVKSINPQE